MHRLNICFNEEKQTTHRYKENNVFTLVKIKLRKSAVTVNAFVSCELFVVSIQLLNVFNDYIGRRTLRKYY